MNNDFSPFNPPAKFWSKSWLSIIQLIANGFLKSTIVIGSYFWIKSLSLQVENQKSVTLYDLSFLIFAAITIVILRLHERYTAEKMSQKYINSIRSSLLKRLMRSSIRDIENHSIGSLSSRLSGDLSALKRWLSLGISRLITHGILLVLTISLVVGINTTLGMIIGSCIVTLLLISALVGNQLKYSIKDVRKNRIRISSLLVERLSSIAMIRTMGNEQKEIKKVNTVANKLEKNIAKQGIFLGLLRGIGESSGLILISLFFLFSQMHNQGLTSHELTALISIILFLNSPIRELGRVQEYFQGAKLSIVKIQELYNIPRIVRGKSKQKTFHDKHASLGKILLRNVSLFPVFEQINFRAKKGERIAVTGKNGSGKSTLLQLILGLIKAESGRIRVNGIAPNKTYPEYRKAHIGSSGVNMGLLKTSLKQNLCYRKPNANDEEIQKLLKFCQLDNMVLQSKNGLLTRVNEKGNNFSSGEIARISLFRALLGHPEILILDEPESYLDLKGFEIIKSLLQNYKGTILLATHNQQLISLCNKRWKIDKIHRKVNKPNAKNNISILRNK